MNEPPSDSIKNALETGRLLEAIDAPFYDLVAKIGRDLVGLESNTILAQDRHHNFESGYQCLTQLRRNVR
jgi:hypothetical protein